MAENRELTWLGCPVCGGQPHVSQLHIRIWKAECIEESCAAIFEVRAGTLEDLNEKWNTRYRGGCNNE